MQIIDKYPCNTANYRKKRNDKIKYIVIHYVGATGGAEANAKYYANNNVGASAHYFVGHSQEDGAVYRSVPDECCAWHCGGTKYYHACRNDSAIGIEMCCHKLSDGTWCFDNVTVDKTVELVRELMKKYNIPAENVIRHYDVTYKVCPAPFVNDVHAWESFKKRLTERAKLESANDIVWELSQRIEINDIDGAVAAVDKARYENSSLYWILYKIVNE